MQVLWKADQLTRMLCSSLNGNQLIVAATMARSLIEISAAFGHETNAIANIWKARKAEPAPDLESLCDFDVKARKIVCQILFGTKLKRDKTAESGVERTNILTLIDNACKELQTPGVRRLYDVLCDTVHPSIGSNRCFWRTTMFRRWASTYLYRRPERPGTLRRPAIRDWERSFVVPSRTGGDGLRLNEPGMTYASLGRCTLYHNHILALFGLVIHGFAFAAPKNLSIHVSTNLNMTFKPRNQFSSRPATRMTFVGFQRYAT